MPPGTVPAAVEVHDSMFGGIVAVLRVSIVGVSPWRRETSNLQVHATGR